MRAATAALIMSSALPAMAGDLRLLQPIDCELGESCFIQNFVDRDPGPGVRDFMCNALTYEGHKGTDFSLPSNKAMNDGVRVLAAAAGHVAARRDGMPDTGMTAEAKSRIDGRECGNGVVLDHGGGWETQYCHMRQGSVSVDVGETVMAGDTLGLVGLSGKTEFPHVHVSVRHDGAVVDPFAPDMATVCGAPDATQLWLKRLAYRPGGLLAIGFANGVPTYEAVKDGTAAQAALDATAPGIVVWGYAFGGRRGDVLRLSIEAPSGQLIEETTTLKKPQAQFFRAAGKRLTGAAWPRGTYEGRVVLEREGRVVDERATAIEVR